MEEDGRELSEEDLFNKQTAHDFLFDEEYTISIGDLEMTTNELISIWGCEDPSGWRELVREKVNSLVKIKRQAIKARRDRENRRIL